MYVRIMGPSVCQGNGAKYMSGYWGQVFIRVLGPSICQCIGAKYMSV